MKYSVIVSLMFLLFTACSKEELPLLPPTSNQTGSPIDTTGGENLIARGALVSNAVSMESDYSNQIWYDLGTNSVVKINLRTDWDLAFDCGLSNNILYLNTALNASVAMTNETDFNKVNSDAGLTYVYEHQSGKSDSLAVGDVSNHRNVFIIDRGLNPAGNPIGKWKAQITLVENGVYYFTYSKLDGSNLNTVTISKNPIYNRVYYSITTNNSLKIEPPKTDYDLVFTQYTHVFVNPPLAYSVNGAIINSYNTEVAEAFNKKFSEIDKSYAETLFYSSNANAIGYGWKEFNFQTNIYNVFPTKNYLLKDASGNLFKIHFLDFYNENGTKGTPSFELVRL